MSLDEIAKVFARHKIAALHFSGGKDSLACLWVLEPFWPHLAVVWVNGGDVFPETLETMRQVREMVPHFIEVKSDVRAQNRLYGYPVDVLPVRNHPNVVRIMHPYPRPPLQSCVACCNDNLWTPMARAMADLGATLIVRGQRNAEVQKSPVRSGDVYEIGGRNIEFLFPVEDWTSEEIRHYLSDKPIGLPANYEYMDTDLACMHCTGHIFENIGKRAYMAKHHPEAYAEVSRRLDVIAAEVDRDMRHLHQARRTGEPLQ